MNTTHRAYSEERGDFTLLTRFIQRNGPAVRKYSTWCLGRLVDWKYGLYGIKRDFAAFTNENAHLWFDGYDELAGFAISENGTAGFAIITLKGYRFLFEEMLACGLENFGQRPGACQIEVTEYQDIEIRALERHGFTCVRPFYTFQFDLTRGLIARPPLQPGFCIVDMRAHPDFRAQRVLRANAFEKIDSLSEAEMQENLKFYNHTHCGPLYHPDTDLCVIAPDGAFASGCEALIDGHNCEADIERVCTHSAYRRLGLARAVIVECLYRLKNMGLRSANITGYGPGAIALYGSLGHASQMKSFVYERKLG